MTSRVNFRVIGRHVPISATKVNSDFALTFFSFEQQFQTLNVFLRRWRRRRDRLRRGRRRRTIAAAGDAVA